MKNYLLNIFQKVIFYYTYFFSDQINEKVLYKEIIKNNNLIVFDVGSNLGNYSKFVSNLFKNKNLKVYSFEPIVELLINQKIKYGELHKNNLVISDQDAFVDFFIHPISSQSSLINSFNIDSKNIKKVNIKSTTLINFLNEYNIKQIDILKIDTEGNELKILQSSIELFKNNLVKILKIEISFYKNNKYSDENFVKIMDFFNLLNYTYIGSSNNHYKNNKIFYFDAFFVNNIDLYK